MKWLGLVFLIGLSSGSCKKTSLAWEVTDFYQVESTRSQTPDLYLSPQGSLYLSWIEVANDTLDQLKFSKLEAEPSNWSTPITIASGTDWFVNWADFPTISTFAGSDLNLLASILHKSGSGGTYDYGIQLALSRDGGQEFKIIDSLHTPLPGEHGFVSMQPFNYDNILVVWLDGGHTKSLPGENEHPAMTLSAALVYLDGRILQKTILDDTVCDCCQTDIAMTPKGPLVVYRNRTDEEERDIYYTRLIESQWTQPSVLAEEHWKINGCPVNGPAVAAIHHQVAVVYYTESKGKPELKFVLSSNAGEDFSMPTNISSDFPMGRVDITWGDPDHLFISYLQKNHKESDIADIRVACFSSSGQLWRDQKIASTSSARKSGFPILVGNAPDLYIAYTEVSDEKSSQVQVKKISWSDL
jgi:hypothetical protein